MATNLHYGGSINRKSGKLGPKPSTGATFRKTKRFEDIVRLELAGFTEVAIAAMLGLSKNRLRHIKKQPDYLVARMKLTCGVILDHENKLAEIKEQRKEILTQMLPAALQCIAQTLNKKPNGLAEEKHQVSVAQDLLDRQGTFAKVTRAEVKSVDAFNFERTDSASNDLIAALRGVASPTGDSGMVSAGTLKQNEEFSNSQTISAIDQQVALDELEASASLLLDLPSATPEIQ